ncbi:FAD-binding oxidoreductase [Lysobacter korlensis]|uniref:FAD-binding oxidoreductase n=1 Tax=Lysobacter korlensis TaxID=553636 RepID=A0ABV6RVN9_9GAMM
MTIENLRTTISGAVYTETDDGFPEMRAGHSGKDAPDVVIRARTAEDVANGVRYAAAEGLPLGVRSGGHSHWGQVPGGLIVDLRDLREIEVRHDLVRVGGGATWGEVAETIGRHGLAISSGDTASVGVGGLTLGGGVGWMVRLWGLALDQLVSAEVVTAAGKVVRAAEDENPELFWAIRGGGGNFGVVTRFDFLAHRLPGVVSGVILFEEDVDQVALLSAWRDVMRSAPEELNVTFIAMPPMGMPGPAGPQLVVCYAGDDEEAAAAAIAPLLRIPGVASSEIAPKSYADVLAPDMGPAELPPMVDGNGLAEELTDDLIQAVVEASADSSPAVLMIRYLRGAYNRVPSDATAFPYRSAEVLLISAAFLAPDAPDTEYARLRAVWDTVRVQTLGIYGNFTVSTEGYEVDRMYPVGTLRRLREAKRAWDPDNLFGRNHNIRP